jgi:glycosyltransferase involved in cell wall biosynthesis
MIAFSHATGNQNSRHAALAMAGAGLLAELWTSISWNDRAWINRLLPAGVRAELHRRSFPGELRPFIRTLPWKELGRLISIRLKCGPLYRDESSPFSIDAVFRAMDRQMARHVLPRLKPDAAYAYEDGAVETFRAASELGIRRVYELPIGYWRAAHAIFREEREREPDWAPTLDGLADSGAKLERKDEELRGASTVIVPSTFVRDTLKLAPGFSAPVHVNPYGGPSGITDTVAVPVAVPAGGRLKVLFVGSLGQRKGLGYVLRAMELLGNAADLTLIGRKTSEHCRPLNEAVKRHRWIPSVPHAEVLREMSRHDVLVFPSLFEGFGLVILEGMSQGLPVITTPNSGGLDVVTDGADGFGVPIRSAEAIAEKLELLAGNRTLLAQMKIAATETARRHSWESYRNRLVEILRAALQPAA